MSGGPGFQEVFDRIEAARWSGIELIAATAGFDLERADVRAALRGWVGFLEGAILGSLDLPDADRDVLIATGMAVFAAATSSLAAADE